MRSCMAVREQIAATLSEGGDEQRSGLNVGDCIGAGVSWPAEARGPSRWRGWPRAGQADRFQFMFWPQVAVNYTDFRTSAETVIPPR